MIDSENQKLLRDVTSHKADRMKQIQRVIADIQQRVSFLGSLAKYTEALRDQGAVSDVAQQARNLHDRADELMNHEDIHCEISDLGSLQVTFEAVWLSKGMTECLIGNVK